MEKRDKKRIKRITSRPPQAKFSDVRWVLALHGWEQDRQDGSHVIFAKADERSISVPLVGGSKVKRVYLDQICERLGLD